jgi:hypothetical protein
MGRIKIIDGISSRNFKRGLLRVKWSIRLLFSRFKPFDKGVFDYTGRIDRESGELIRSVSATYHRLWGWITTVTGTNPPKCTELYDVIDMPLREGDRVINVFEFTCDERWDQDIWPIK